MPTVRIPKPFRKFSDGAAQVTTAGSTAGEVLDNLLQRYPDLRPLLYDDSGALITTTDESINVILNRRDIRELEGNDTPLTDTDRLLILRSWPAAISGKRKD
ncbi:MoaD/ThiS family protein [Streptococcus pseudopneumoniae]|uniref:MoaD/ThiS family protein n=1 Tax=Streptococcus pseudopneumoniae TaxID=257758 RepID=UPI00110C2BD7|nr:MoaD/ThiS family protein [Streptococcus pseudopneumoniae]TMR65577.1 MoaD/ThiS family protein [Streptococcus pseudopneumoniae]